MSRVGSDCRIPLHGRYRLALVRLSLIGEYTLVTRARAGSNRFRAVTEDSFNRASFFFLADDTDEVRRSI